MSLSRAILEYLNVLSPVPAGISLPTITFSFKPCSTSIFPFIAASVRTRVVSWNEAAEINDGKTTVVGPLIAMFLADCKTSIFEVVPAALLDFSAGVLRERFSSAVRKPVFTFVFDRYSKVTPQLYAKLLSARSLRAVVVANPSSIKSFMLKFVEICHNLNRQKHLGKEIEMADSVFKPASSLFRRILGETINYTSSTISFSLTLNALPPLFRRLRLNPDCVHEGPHARGASR